ncbi:hypothetical protein CYMTET_4497 [Cymbomonas tetramitiformis]|uniref:PB1 domain-containing protein n=1 Tax=Cymbomonas tetramitiformis TaxID=36881 RepID=A0AAE0H1C3_9CHLO|nr:hypothetical protein CYMTET_4497 [Cymbomonas tetramitiformis]
MIALQECAPANQTSPTSIKPTSCKAVFGSKSQEHDVRRFLLQPDAGFDFVNNKLTAAYPDCGRLTIKYLDDEGDYVTLADDDDYQVALSLCTENIFRVYISSSPGNADPKESLEASCQPKFKAFEKVLKKFPKVRKNFKHELLKQAWKEPSSSGNPRKHPWPASGVSLRYVSGPGSLHTEEVVALAVGGILPGQEVDIGLDLVAPTAPGAYQGFWRLQGPAGNKFGQRLGCNVLVVGEDDTTSPEEDSFVEVSAGDSASEHVSFEKKKKNKPKEKAGHWPEEMRRLKELGWTDVDECARLLNKYNGNLERTACKLSKRASKAKAASGKD